MSGDNPNTCWNCGHSGHRFSKCRKPLNVTAIAARKAKFLENKYGKNGSKRALYEVAQAITDVFDLDEADDDETVTTYFEEAFDNLEFTDEENEKYSGEKEVSFAWNMSSASEDDNPDF